ncbi:S-layer homology domain-containing protein [Urinicoccus massiliensis]|uniref:S-layer homology domain-containing protein n=1 Tax=Urinicoccus massiliensis TaxID=1723382 RepID=UPI0009317194|nr:S-layer homology domain-containing protein [Urinicoccus massiliensis]
MSKNRKLAGALSAVLLISSFPSSLLAVKEIDNSPIYAEKVGANHSNVLQMQVKNTPIEKNEKTLSSQERSSSEVPEDENVIPDKTLQKLINVSLDRKEDEKITKSDLAGLTEIAFYCYDDGDIIHDLKGLENAKNVTELLLHYDGTDISYLKDLTKLESLQIWGLEKGQEQKDDFVQSELTDISSLKKLTNLTMLYINNTKVSNLTPLKDLTLLDKVSLQNNEITSDDLVPLQNLPKTKNGRTYLSLDGNKIADGRELKKLDFSITASKQRITIKPKSNIFENPCINLWGERYALNNEHLSAVTTAEDSSINFENQKYKIIGDIDNLQEIKVDWGDRTGESHGGTLTIDLSELWKNGKDKNLSKAKEEANKAIEGLANLSDEEKTTYKDRVTKAEKTQEIEKAVEEAKKANQAKQEKHLVNIHVSGYADKTYIQKLYNAEIKIENTDTDGDSGKKDEGSALVWELGPGTYTVKISHPGFQGLTQENVQVDKNTTDLYFKLQKNENTDQDDKHQYAQPSIQKISLVEFGNPKRVLGKGSINGNLISFVVKDKQDRERIFNNKATIRIDESTNIHAYNTLSYIVPSRFETSDGADPEGDLRALSGYVDQPINFNPDGTTSLFIKGKGGKASEYSMVIKSDDIEKQHVVLFDMAADKSNSLGGVELKYKGERQGGKECQELVQLVEHGSCFKEPFQWISDNYPKIKASWPQHTLGEFLGWYDERYGGKKYTEETPIEEDTVLYPRFERTSMPTEYNDPFTVWIPGNVDVFKAPLKVSWSVNGTDFKDFTRPEDVKVEKGDTLYLKIDDSASEWKLSGMEARYGLLKLPIEKDDQGVYHLKPIPSHDLSDLYPKNCVYLSWVKSGDEGEGAFDLNKQHNIHLLQEGTKVEFTNIQESTDDKTELELLSKFQEGHTIRFQVQGEEITEVNAQDQADKPVKLNKDSETKDEKTGLITRNYSFVMPADDVDLIVKGTYRKKLSLRRIDFNFKDSQGKKVGKDQIKSLTITAGGETYTFDDLSKDTNIPVSNLGYTYFYTVVTKDGVLYQGKFTKTAKELGDSYTIELKAENPGKEKTKKDFDSLVATAEGLIKDSSYTQESRDKLQVALTSAKHQGNLQAYTEACKIITDAMSGLKKANTLPDKEKAKESLEGLIRRLSNLKKADYESKAWDAFDKEMYKAKAVLKDANSSEDALNSARIALTQAKDELDKHKIVPEDMTKAEKNLRDLIKTIERLEEKNYTKETWKDLKDTLDQAKDELNYSKRTERSLERAYDKLNKAYKDLKLADKLAQEAEKINQGHKVLVRNSSYQNMTDIKSHWARDFIKYCMDRGYLVGTSITNFSPDRPTTRAEFVTVLSRLAGIKEENYKKNKFTDVPKGVYYEAAVNWAQEKKIVEGTGSSRFAPDQTMTREEMATILDRYFQATNKAYGNRGALYFKDQGEMSSWAADSVKRMTQAGILHGTDRNTFEPKSSFTRAELATVIYQLNK